MNQLQLDAKISQPVQNPAKLSIDGQDGAKIIRDPDFDPFYRVRK